MMVYSAMACAHAVIDVSEEMRPASIDPQRAPRRMSYSHSAGYEQLLNHPRELPEDQSIEFLRRMRATHDPANLLESMYGAFHSVIVPRI